MSKSTTGFTVPARATIEMTSTQLLEITGCPATITIMGYRCMHCARTLDARGHCACWWRWLPW
jgi:hypothetical protein